MTRLRERLAALLTGLVLAAAVLGPTLLEGPVAPSALLPAPAAPRSGHWPKVRAEFLLARPECAACGASHDTQVHHVQPFHLHAELELEPSNFIGLCGPHGCHAHFRLGHRGNWQDANPHVRRDAAAELARRRAGWKP